MDEAGERQIQVQFGDHVASVGIYGYFFFSFSIGGLRIVPFGQFYDTCLSFL